MIHSSRTYSHIQGPGFYSPLGLHTNSPAATVSTKFGYPIEQRSTNLRKSNIPARIRMEYNPTHEIREGVSIVWQIPPNPKAILYLAHGRGEGPFSFWPSTPSVPQCTGDPEHKVVTRDALERGFAVIAGKSVTNEWETWPAATIDVQKAVKILKAWRREHGLEDLPLSAWGTSCGGGYVSTLATVVKMHALILMVSSGHNEAIKAAVPGEYPATLFACMTRDESKFAECKNHLEILRSKGIPAAIEEVLPEHVDAHYLAEHLDRLDEDQAVKLHALFVEYGVVAEDNSLNRELMRGDIEPYLRKAGILPTVDDAQRQQDEVKLKADKKKKEEGKAVELPNRAAGGGGPQRGGVRLGPPPQVHPLAGDIFGQLRIAIGVHSLTARHDKEIFAWLEGKGWPKAQAQ